MFLTKVKYIDKPLLRWFLTGAGVIPVATDDLGAARNAVTAAVEAVQSGRLVGIFPEGTRSPDGRLHRGKTGVARIALAVGRAGDPGRDHRHRSRLAARGQATPAARGADRLRTADQVRCADDEAKDPALNRALTDQVMAAIRDAVRPGDVAEINAAA